MKSRKVTYRYDNEDDKAKESALEEFLFGSGAAVNKLLAKPEEGSTDIADLVRQAEAAADSDEDDGLLFVEDRLGQQDEEQQQEADDDDADDAAGPGPGSLRLQQQEAAGKGKKRRAWLDPADEGVTVQVASVPRLRKLRQSKGQTELSGTAYEAALRRQHTAVHPRTTWAAPAQQQRQRQRKAGSAAAGDAVIDEYEEPDEETAERLLMSGSGLLLGGGAAGQRALLAPGALELSRLRDANGSSPSDAVVQALQFHPNGQLMLTAGFDKRLKLFQVDGLRNSLVQSLFLQDCPIHTAAFAAGGGKVVAAGRRPFYYIADLNTAQLERVVTPPSIHHQGGVSSAQQPPQQQRTKGGKGSKASRGPAGGRTGMNSCESFAASSDPARPLLAFLGDGGHIGLVSLGSRRPVGSLKMNGSARAAAFSSDGNTLITAGGDGVLYTWDLRSQRCLQQQRDEGATNCTALALSADSSYLAAGGSSGVVNVYRRPAGLLSPVNAADADVPDDRPTAGFGVRPAAPAPLKALMNLTTSIDSLSFSHDSQMLLMASRLKKDSLRVVHLPSLTVFANWPTSRSPLQYVHCAAFSPHSGFLGIGNAKGRALLYRLHHYPQA